MELVDLVSVRRASRNSLISRLALAWRLGLSSVFHKPCPRFFTNP